MRGPLSPYMLNKVAQHILNQINNHIFVYNDMLLWFEFFQLIIISEAEGFNPYMIHCPLHTYKIDE
jgi:hypothetical protein